MTEDRQPEIPEEVPSVTVMKQDLDAVRVFLAVVQDTPDTARDIVRRMSPRDRAVLAFYLRDAGRITEEEIEFRETRDRREARESLVG